MCGIIGYCGHRPAVPVVLEGLRRLEYRGYDSGGLCVNTGGKLAVVKKPGKLGELEAALEGAGNLLSATSGIGHTRWATHGEPNEANAHPHMDSNGRLSLIHNGIIENFQEIKDQLLQKGYTFKSQTDSEVLVNLLAEELKAGGTMREVISRTLAQVDGAYAIVVMDSTRPGMIWGARQTSPLVLGHGVGENFLASDIPAFLPYTRQVAFLEDGQLVRMDASGWQVFETQSLKPVDVEIHTISWDVQAAQKGGYKHFMLKEIFEQPRVIRDGLAGRVDRNTGRTMGPELEALPTPKRLFILACGTSYYSGLWGQQLLEAWARIPCISEIASEFRYRDPLVGPGDVILAISQSGETIDTLAALRKAKELGATTVGICNVVGSTIARECDHVLYTQAGPEISVASTKALCSQMVALLLLTMHWGAEHMTAEQRKSLVNGLEALPAQMESALPAMRDTAAKLARIYAEARSFLYLGRGLGFPMALEGALKLKEIAYIHAEGYPAGEMKHGPIALIDPKFPTFALALDDGLFPKVKSNLIEVQARGGRIVALTHAGLDLDVDHPWVIPNAYGPLASFLALPAMQLFAYETADYLGKDVDQPRNLAKSVTVE